VDRLGVGDLAVLSGAGGAEMNVVADIWRASRGELTVADVQREHGFHGPLEGEVSGTVWRENAAPLGKLIEQYAHRDDAEDPRSHGTRTAARREAMVADVLRAVPAAKRPATKLLLRLAAERIPLRGVAKRAFLQAIDATRGSARRLGDLLAADGRLDTPDDVFYLTGPEILGPLPPDAKALVAERRERRAHYQRHHFAATEWAGLPELIEIDAAEPEPGATRLTGTGVSAGVVEGVARVVTDPSFAEVEDDEILVASTTDPSWSSIMFISSALVVDLGGALSHAAVVARELQIPCVVNTRNGTRVIKSGDRLRVDGSAGTVEIL
jgi:pyruvate,water dikinase